MENTLNQFINFFNANLGLFVAFAIAFVIFLILRELMCWYWKINEMISLLQEIKNSLSIIAAGNITAAKTQALEKEARPRND